MAPTLRSPLVQRAVFVGMVLLVVSLGVGSLLHGSLHYENWWCGIVFAPFAILIGMGLLFIVVFAPEAILETREK